MKAQLLYIGSVISSKLSKKKQSYFKHVMLNENLWSVQKQINTILQLPIQSVDHILDAKQFLNKSLLTILSVYGMPYFLKRNRFKNGVHTVLIYRKRIFGTRSRIVYHFVDNQIVYFQMRLRPNNIVHAEEVSKNIIKHFQLQSLVSGDSLELMDSRQTLLDIQYHVDFYIAMYPNPNTSIGAIGKLI